MQALREMGDKFGIAGELILTICKKFSRYYKVAALMLLNTIVFFLLLNTGFFLLYQIKDRRIARQLQRVSSTTSSDAIGN